MLRQTLAAVWVWLCAQLPSYQLPTLELTVETTLSATAHNGRVLICSQPISLAAVAANLGSGFFCTLINVSDGNVTFDSGVTSSSGTSTLAPGQAATLTCATYSGGELVYVWMTAPNSLIDAPGQINGLVATAESASAVILAWIAPTSSPTSYVVQYRVSGTTGWSTAPAVSTLGCTITGLLSATSYDFIISAANSAGVGSPSAIVSVTTSVSPSLPGQVGGLTTSEATSSGISLSWSPPGSGGTASSYTVQYRVSGATSWSAGAAGMTSTSLIVNGLLPVTSYDFEVIAVNATGAGLASSAATASTTAGSVTAITWNVPPSGSYIHGIGAIGISAHVSPSSASVQFGFSTSPTAPPIAWTIGSYVNADLWGTYVDTPSIPGAWYGWVEGMDGSSATACLTGFLVT